MALTAAQKTLLKADFLANTATIPAGQPWTNGFAGVQVKDLPNDNSGNATAAGWYNQTASPAYQMFRTNVSQDEIMQNGFDWTRVDNLSVGKARIWEWMFNNSGRTINPAKDNIRAGINAVWVGTAADLAVRAAVYLHCYAPGSYSAKLFATGGTGVVSGANGSGPGVSGYTAPLTGDDIEAARAS